MKIGAVLGFLPTIALVISTGMIGAFLARQEGFRVMREWQHDISQGRIPKDGVISGLLLLVGGVLLVTPGVLTDGVGLLLLIPMTRRALAAGIKKHYSGRSFVSWEHQSGFSTRPGQATPFSASPFSSAPFSQASSFGHRQTNANVIDVDGEELDRQVID